jgi:hypothetical protein
MTEPDTHARATSRVAGSIDESRVRGLLVELMAEHPTS